MNKFIAVLAWTSDSVRKVGGGDGGNESAMKTRAALHLLGPVEKM